MFRQERQGLGAEPARLHSKRQAVPQVEAVLLFLELVALGQGQDARRDLGLAGIVDQGGHGKVGQGLLVEADLLAQQHAQCHGVDGMELLATAGFVPQQMK